MNEHDVTDLFVVIDYEKSAQCADIKRPVIGVLVF